MAEGVTYFSILALDVEGSGRRTNSPKGAMREALYEQVRAAAAEAGLSWKDFTRQDTGDGILATIEPTVPIALLAGPMLRALAHGLAAQAQGPEAPEPLRLRIALHHGLVHRDRYGMYGDALDYTARLVDSQPVRDVLTAAKEANAVFIVSDEVYRDVIVHAYRQIDPAEYGPVRFDAKNLKNIKAWITVPGRPFPPGLPEFVADPPASPAQFGSPQPGAVDTDMNSATGPDSGASPIFHNEATTIHVHGDQVGVKNGTVHNTGSGTVRM